MFRSSHRSGTLKRNMLQRPWERLASYRYSRLISLPLGLWFKNDNHWTAYLSEHQEIKKLIEEYYSSERLAPNKERIAWAVRLQLRDTPGLLLVARDKDVIVGVALAAYTPSAELGRVMTVNDFFCKTGPPTEGSGKKTRETSWLGSAKV